MGVCPDSTHLLSPALITGVVGQLWFLGPWTETATKHTQLSASDGPRAKPPTTGSSGIGAASAPCVGVSGCPPAAIDSRAIRVGLNSEGGRNVPRCSMAVDRPSLCLAAICAWPERMLLVDSQLQSGQQARPQCPWLSHSMCVPLPDLTCFPAWSVCSGQPWPSYSGEPS